MTRARGFVSLPAVGWTRALLAVSAAALLVACAGPGSPGAPGAAEGPALSWAERYQLQRHARLRQAAPNGATTMAAAPRPMPLPAAASAPSLQWQWEGQRLSADDYLRRHPVTALLVARDGQVVYERYAHGRGPQHHFLSNSMAKTVLGLGLGLAQAEGRLPAPDTPLHELLPALRDTAYGQTTLRNLSRMGSGVHFEEVYNGQDDNARFRRSFMQVGVVQASRAFNDREAPPGSRFHYAGVEPALMGAALRAATGQGLSAYLEPRLWQAIGAEAPADWETDALGVELGQCCVWARARDWLRLGMVLAHDGRRPDTGAVVFDREWLLGATEGRRQDPPFRANASRWGYAQYFWLMPGAARRFALLGVYGQAIFVDPASRTVMVHLAAHAQPSGAGTAMARERFALWQGVLQSLAATPAPTR